MKAPSVAVLDFETHAIQHRPEYPPKPVGFSLKLPSDRKARYYAWGHPEGNNCSIDDAARALFNVWQMSETPILCHNAKFDLDVAETHFHLPPLPWHRVHDTLFLLFLQDPHATSLSLKPSAERLLGMAPTEQDAVRQWLIDNKVVLKNDKRWGAHISKAPGKLVGTYADGDVERTLKLFNKLYPEIVDRGMKAAYERELRLLPILLRNERQGLRLDTKMLEIDLEQNYRPASLKVEAHIRKRLKAPNLNIDSNDELADALVAAGMADENLFALTPTGKRSVSGDSLKAAITDPKIFLALGYHSRLSTCLRMFMEPWLAAGKVLQPTWHQVRQHGERSGTGARSGRLITSDPNLLNLSKSFEGRNDGYTHPKFLGVPELPLVRRYILPNKGRRWCHRDYNQQELRVLAHYEDGALLAAYLENARLDVHDFVRLKIKELLGIEAQRGQTKTLNFGTIYGMGVASMAERMEIPVEEAQKLKKAQLAVLPGLKDVNQSLRELAAENRPLRTWGGREYYCEKPQIVDGRTRTFEYKMLNYLIQPSAADCTKEALIRYDEARKDGQFLITVYDEINIDAPPKAVRSEMAILREVMESVEFDVPMLSDGKVGASWGELEKFKEPAFDMGAWKQRRAA